MLQAALEAEVNAFLDEHHQRRDANGRRLVVRNGYLPPREVVTGTSPLEIRQTRARAKSESAAERVEFLPKIIPAYLRRSQSVEEFIPWLYPKGISTNDFSEALAALLGKEVAGLSPNVIVRLKETWCAEFVPGHEPLRGHLIGSVTGRVGGTHTIVLWDSLPSGYPEGNEKFRSLPGPPRPPA